MKVLILFVIFSLCKYSYGQNSIQNISNSKYSFKVYYDFWEKATNTTLMEKQSIDESITKRRHNYTYFFYKKGQEYNSHPQFVVQQFNTPNNSYEDFKKKMNSNGLEIILEKNSSLLKKHIEDLIIGKALCDDKNKTIIFQTTVKPNDNNEITSLTFIAFSNNTLVQFVFSTTTVSYRKLSFLFNDTIKSFEWVH